jgi:hypothetical protein
MKLILVLFLSLVILSATILSNSHDVFAKSKKFDRQVNKAIDKFSDKKHWGDICTVVATKQNNDSKKIDNSKCGPIVPPPPKNQKPVIQPINEIKAVVNETVNVNASITDDGVITLVVWTQNSGPQASFISSNNSFWFIPAVNGSYEFQVKATDNGGLSSTEKFTVVVGSSNPQPEPCPVGTHLENGVCVPDPQPQPTNVTKIALVGDLSGSTILNKIKSAKVDNAFILGDYYQSSASGINSYLGQVKQIAPVVNCLLGNHEASNEDGNSQVEQAALAQCGDHWSLSIGKVGFIGFNSNGNLDANAITIPTNVDSIVIMSHKSCQSTPPNSHHPLESSVVKFCNDLKQKIDSNIKLYFVNAHNHVSSNNADKTIFTSGGGGRSHYTCGTSSEWPFCNNQKYGYLEMDIDKNTGDISTKWQLS